MNSRPTTARLRRPDVVWCAVLVALLFALVPTFNRVLARAGVPGALAMEICSAQGTRTIVPDAARTVPPDTPDSAMAKGHCPFCLHQADRFAPPPQSVLHRPLALRPQHGIPALLAFFYLDRHPLWAPPRGPPAETGM